MEKKGIENSTLRNNLLLINEMIEKESFLELLLKLVEVRLVFHLILELDSGYVIDGRTRLYAALAANKSINVTVITTETFGVLNDKN